METTTVIHRKNPINGYNGAHTNRLGNTYAILYMYAWNHVELLREHTDELRLNKIYISEGIGLTFQVVHLGCDHKYMYI